MSARTFCIAPMMDHTDRHFRYFLRVLSPHAWLFTEMVTTGAVLHGDTESLLGFDPAEQPVALQLGGSDPEDLARCAAIAQDFGYDEVNLNVGCPSSRVSAGRFGACLMEEPLRVADCVAEMQAKVHIPVTVKCRIGVDGQDTEETLAEFVQTVANAGCQMFYVHARIAVLSGLSPKQNRTIPPLNYERVWALKRKFPHLTIVINGGIRSTEEVQQHLAQVDGVMVGRLACEDHWAIRQIEQALFPDSTAPKTPLEAFDTYLPYLEVQCRAGVPLARMTRHITGLFHGCPGAKSWRQAAACPDSSASALRTLRETACRVAFA